MPHWLGLNGELVLIVDRSDHVVRAEYFRSRVISWSLSDYLWERFTWLQVTKTSMAGRIVWYLALALGGILAMGTLFVRAQAPNMAAWHGLIGLMLGPVLSVAIFSDGFFTSRSGDMLYEAVLGPFVATAIGIIVGWARRRLNYPGAEHTARPIS